MEIEQAINFQEDPLLFKDRDVHNVNIGKILKTSFTKRSLNSMDINMSDLDTSYINSIDEAFKYKRFDPGNFANHLRSLYLKSPDTFKIAYTFPQAIAFLVILNEGCGTNTMKMRRNLVKKIELNLKNLL